MAGNRDLPRDIGEFIRDLRHNARISLRQLAEQAGVSNPYLSQIERGLRKPSAEVLQQLASALRVSTPIMYLRAGLLDRGDDQGVLAAVANDPDLTEPQKQTLTQIYETFRRENARDTGPEPEAATPKRRTETPKSTSSRTAIRPRTAVAVPSVPANKRAAAAAEKE
ncbi:MAG TPA: helix-turn-helix domain-containing protein [Micromonosporaceae bacterium]|nr:helix-turn-helix domain-containing protein [Micromonosporaceae bacterium]